ncbi:hypothetical protein [Hymenobacter fodinae]|uniref:Uncharacterized protein n=1 Tax=Hymenobacter fodinae TaxID=2510796 RepID=A0A4Z0P0T2_9BACT|nr:hypothetical protein [Hymenobacter fodinae]TGE04766.1 hypothetical protein EU556_21535 [Hymenobacter fodinae]
MPNHPITAWESFWGHIALFIPLFLLVWRKGYQLQHVALILGGYFLLFLWAYHSLSETYLHRVIDYWNKTEIGFMDPTGEYTFEPEFVGEGNYHAILLLIPLVALFILHQVDKRRRTSFLLYTLLAYPGFLYVSYTALAGPGLFAVDTHKPETYIARTERVTAP